MKAFDPHAPVQTRDGNAARVVSWNTKGDFPLTALICDGQGEEYPDTFRMNGSWSGVGSGESCMDLINADPAISTQSFWVNLFADGIFPTIHKSREAADWSGTDYRLACVQVVLNFREGDGLSV